MEHMHMHNIHMQMCMCMHMSTWVHAERPQHWDACYRWFKESWTSAILGV